MIHELDGRGGVLVVCWWFWCACVALCVLLVAVVAVVVSWWLWCELVGCWWACVAVLVCWWVGRVRGRGGVLV